MDLKSLIILALKISIVAMVFSMGLEATFSDAMCLFRRPRDLARELLSMNVVMPALALALALTFRGLHPAVRIALVALSVSPVPPFFPRGALKAGGKQDYTIGLLTAASLLSIFAVPLTMAIFQAVTGLPLKMTARSVADLVLLTVLAPLFAGIILRTLAPRFAQRMARPVGIASAAILAAGLIPVFFRSAGPIVSLIGNGTLLGMAVFAVAGLAVGHFLGGPDPGDRNVLALATSSRHPAIAAAIARANFPNQSLAVPAILLYLIASVILAGFYRRMAARAGAAPTRTGKRVVA